MAVPLNAGITRPTIGPLPAGELLDVAIASSSADAPFLPVEAPPLPADAARSDAVRLSVFAAAVSFLEVDATVFSASFGLVSVTFCAAESSGSGMEFPASGRIGGSFCGELDELEKM